MKKFISIISLSFFLGLVPSFAEAPVNKTCPVKGKAVNAESKVAKVEVKFCCDKCKSKFDADVVAGLKKFAKTEEGKCCISGKPVKDSKKSTVAVGVCCGGCKKKVESDPKKHLAGLK